MSGLAYVSSDRKLIVKAGFTHPTEFAGRSVTPIESKGLLARIRDLKAESDRYETVIPNIFHNTNASSR